MPSAPKRKSDTSCTSPKKPIDLGPVIKSPLDSKNYKAIKLENGLTALLVSTCRHEMDVKGVNTGSQDQLTQKIKEFNRKYLEMGPDPPPSGKGNSSSSSRLQPVADIISKLRKSFSNALSPPPAKSPKLVRCCPGPSTVCLTIGAGSFHDPEDACGLAHLVEHLVFLGSKQFPQPNQLFLKVFENGGFVNASTFAEQTQYYFSCYPTTEQTPPAFEACLRILVDGITDPLLNAKLVAREVEAIDSEYGIKQTSDLTRLNDFIRSRGRLNHPLTRFYWGNKESLSRSTLLQRIKDWRERYYRANYMTVCIQAPLPIDKIEDLVVTYFSDIPPVSPSCPLPSPTMELFFKGEPFDSKTFHTQYYIVPVGHMTCVTMTWCLPPCFWQDYETKPLHYVRTLINSAAPGGLIHYLKHNKKDSKKDNPGRHWITEAQNCNAACSCSDYFCRNSFGSLFTISIDLTEEGYRDKEEVVTAVFSYLKLLKKIDDPQQPQYSQLYFNAMRETLSNSFHFQNWEEMLESARNTSLALQQVKPMHALTSQQLMPKYNPKILKQCLNHLSPRTACFLYVSNSKENTDICKKEAWACHIKFKQVPIPEARYEELEKVEPYPEFYLPDPGYFLCKEIQLVSHPPCEKGRDGILHESGNKLLIRQMSEARSPCISRKVSSASIAVFFASPIAAGQSRMKQGHIELWNQITNDRVISRVGHRFDPLCMYELGVSDEGILVQVAGPSTHLTELLVHIVTEAFNLNLCKVYFDYLRLDLVKLHQNDIFDVEELSKDVQNFLLLSNHVSFFQLKDSILNISHPEFIHLIETFRSRMRIEVEIQGVFFQQDLAELITLFESLKYKEPSVVSSMIPERSTLFPRGTSILSLQGLHHAYVTSFVLNYYQFGSLTKPQLRYFNLLYHYMRKRINTQLRTVEQLGYMVNIGAMSDIGSAGYSVLVATHPKNFTTDHVDHRIDNFLRLFFNTYLSSRYQNNPRESIFARHLSDKDPKGDFDQLRKFYVNYLHPNGPGFQKLSIQVSGFLPDQKVSKKEEAKLNSVDPPPSYELMQVQYRQVDDKDRKALLARRIYVIDDIYEYKKSLGLYPVSNE